MITLGQASNYSIGRTFRHLLAWGTKKDFDELKVALAEHYQVKAENIALYHTGRSALAMAIKTVAPEGGAKVYLPGLTCIAVVRAIKAAGCEPVFIDIVPENLEYNYEKLEQELQKNSDGRKNILLAQNTLGYAWHAEKLEEIAKKYNLIIVEDLAHSAGRFYAGGEETGMIGEAVALSFGKGKAIDTISGGAVILRGKTADQPLQKPKLADRLRDRWYPVFGGIARGLWQCKIGQVFIGGLVKIGWVQRSADAELNLEHRLTYWQAKLAKQQLANSPSTPLREYRLVENRAEVLVELQKAGYCLEEIWYDTPVSPARYAEEADFPAQKCPETVKIAQEIINIPTWYHAEKLQKAYEIINKYQAEKPHGQKSFSEQGETLKNHEASESNEKAEYNKTPESEAK